MNFIVQKRGGVNIWKHVHLENFIICVVGTWSLHFYYAPNNHISQ